MKNIMKKLTFILALSILCVLGKAKADVTLPADYNSFFAASATNADGTTLEKSYSATVQEWFRKSYTGSSSVPTIQANSLGFANYVDNYLSKEIVLARTYSSAVRCSAFQLYSTADATLGTYYASVLINVSQATSTGKEILSFDKLSGGTAPRARVFIKSGTTGFKLAIASNTLGSTSEYTTTEYSYNTTHLLVIKYIIGASTEDASLFVNPTVGDTEPSAIATAIQSATSGGQAICFNVYKQDGLASKIAGIRIGKSWADVVKNGGKLPAPSLLPVENITSTGFTAKWTTVAAATGYDVYVYQGGVQVGSTQNVLGQTASNLEITGLSGNTTYTYKVVAKGNGTSSLDSDISAASEEISTLPTSNVITVSSATNISSLTLTSASDVVITANTLTVNIPKTVNSITVAPGAGLQLVSGQTLTAGTVMLQSDATGTATMVDNTTTAPQAITATVQQYITEGRNWYMSIPLASGASSLLNKGTSVVCFDEPSGNWLVPAANTLNKLRGYVQVATSTPSVTGTTGTVDFTGVVNTGAHSISLTRSAGKTGFNLVGNPYPSYLDWNMVTKTNVSNTMWFRTKEGGVYKFYTFVANGSAGVGSPATVTNKIPPMQAFWVRVNTEGTGSIAVDNNMRSHKDVAGNIMKAPSQTPQKLLRLQVSNGVNTDETVLYFNANASDAFDQYDAQKRSNGEPTVPEIFTQVGTEQLVINGMSQVKYNTEIPIGFSTDQANNFSISANEISNFETGTHVILIDKLNPTVENEITNGTAYNFSAPVTAATTNRFSLLFRAPGVATGVDNAIKLNAQVFVNAANQITIIAPEKSNYAVYNAVGMKIENGILNTERETINAKLNTGVYVVAVNNKATRVIIK